MFATPVIAAGIAFACTPTHVWDGDGPIWCAEGPKIRLSGIAAREIDESCKPNHPCPATSGVAARDQLVSLIGKRTGTAPTGHILVRGPTMRCESVGNGRGSRTAAWCWSAKVLVNCAMVHSGAALAWKRYGGDRCLAAGFVR
nr:hypothetical protein [Allosphingosinicella indica]